MIYTIIISIFSCSAFSLQIVGMGNGQRRVLLFHSLSICVCGIHRIDQCNEHGTLHWLTGVFSSRMQIFYSHLVHCKLLLPQNSQNTMQYSRIRTVERWREKNVSRFKSPQTFWMSRISARPYPSTTIHRVQPKESILNIRFVVLTVRTAGNLDNDHHRQHFSLALSFTAWLNDLYFAIESFNENEIFAHY